MRFFIQMGHGMMAMNRELLANFDSGLNSGVIIWPRTLEQAQIERHAQEVRGCGATVLFDPCFYIPDTTREKILNLPYWNGFDFDTVDFTGDDGAEFCRRVIEYQIENLNVTDIILPGRYTNVRNDDWLQMHANFADVASEMDVSIPIYSTIALGPDIISDIASFDAVLNEVINYPVNGVYFLYHPPNQAFLSCEDLFIMNLLSGFLSLSLANKKVILGYANQQDLLFAAAGVETIASGNFRNVRSFDPSNFEEHDERVIQRATWYYDGQSLCEFRLQQLGLAYQRLGMNSRFGPETQYSCEMLSSPNPATVRWPESNAFKHCLSVLREQWLSLGEAPRAQRYQVVDAILRQAQEQISSYQSEGLQIVDRAAETTAALSCWNSALGSFIATENARLAGL